MSPKNTQEIVVSFEGVKMKDFRAYWDAVVRNDWEAQDRFFALVVQAWPYDLDPSDPESFTLLGLSQYRQVQRAIRQASHLEINK